MLSDKMSTPQLHCGRTEQHGQTLQRTLVRRVRRPLLSILCRKSETLLQQLTLVRINLGSVLVCLELEQRMRRQCQELGHGQVQATEEGSR